MSTIPARCCQSAGPDAWSPCSATVSNPVWSTALKRAPAVQEITSSEPR